MNDVFLVDVPYGQGQLAKPIKDLILVVFFPIFGIFYSPVQVPIFCKFCHDAQIPFAGERLVVFDNIGVVECFQNLYFIIKGPMGFFGTVFALFTVHTLVIVLLTLGLPNLISIIWVRDLEREFCIFALIIAIITIQQRRS